WCGGGLGRAGRGPSRLCPLRSELGRGRGAGRSRCCRGRAERGRLSGSLLSRLPISTRRCDPLCRLPPSPPAIEQNHLIIQRDGGISLLTLGVRLLLAS